MDMSHDLYGGSRSSVWIWVCITGEVHHQYRLGCEVLRKHNISSMWVRTEDQSYHQYEQRCALRDYQNC